MHTTHITTIDLNLLFPLNALLHERNVTRAAGRVHLSQSAMSRTLSRLRSQLGDDLLVRVGRGYERTPRGNELLSELEDLLPKIARLWAGEQFSPATSEGRVRIAMTDYAASVVLPPLLERCADLAPSLSLEVIPWHERILEEDGLTSVHLVVSPISVPSSFRSAPLFEDCFVCVLGLRLKRSRTPLTLKKYLGLKHISVESGFNQQNVVDRALGELGCRRRVALRLPYMFSALRILETTDLVLTIPKLVAGPLSPNAALHQLQMPREIPSIRHSMVWHPRLDNDPLHIWFRSTVRNLFPEGSTKSLASTHR